VINIPMPPFIFFASFQFSKMDGNVLQKYKSMKLRNDPVVF
jgi:hypothetical protein